MFINSCKYVAFTKDKKIVAFSDDNKFGKIIIFNQNGKIEKTILGNKHFKFDHVLLDPNQTKIYAFNRNIYILNTNGVLLETIKIDKNEIDKLSISPNMKYLIISTYNTDELKLYNIKGKYLKTIYSDPLRIQNIQFSSNGKFLLTTSGNRDSGVHSFKIWKFNKLVK